MVIDTCRFFVYSTNSSRSDHIGGIANIQFLINLSFKLIGFKKTTVPTKMRDNGEAPDDFIRQ